MVVFGLFGKHRTSSEIRQFSPIRQSNKIYDVLDELMGLDYSNNGNKAHKNYDDNLNMSSFNIKTIMNNLATKNDINYRDALMNSLYAQVEYLRNDALR